MTTAWHAKEAVRELYAHTDAELALAWVERLAADMVDCGQPDRGPLARPHAPSLEAPDRRVASSAGEQRTDRGGEQLDQAREARRLRLHELSELPDPVTALRREAQLGTARDDHTPVLKTHVPDSSESTSVSAASGTTPAAIAASLGLMAINASACSFATARYSASCIVATS